jgi:hypothetical protein
LLRGGIPKNELIANGWGNCSCAPVASVSFRLNKEASNKVRVDIGEPKVGRRPSRTLGWHISAAAGKCRGNSPMYWDWQGVDPRRPLLASLPSAIRARLDNRAASYND